MCAKSQRNIIYFLVLHLVIRGRQEADVAISNWAMVDSHGCYCSLGMTVLHALPKQPLDYLAEGIGFVNLFGFGVVGVEPRKGAPYAAKVRH